MLDTYLQSPYARLMRLHQPIGIWLLMWPCWWSAALASRGFPPVFTLLLFALGAVLMRSAGCILNDLADQKFDAQVERTKTRPLASGELNPTQAIALLGILVLVSLGIAAALGRTVVLWSILALPLIVIYPWMKRITWWPQLFLGFAFNWGALMGWAAVRGVVELQAVVLYIGCVFWTLGYDTIYAHQDKSDDARIGVKSTALRLGAHTKNALYAFYALAVLCWGMAGWMMSYSFLYYVCVLFAGIQMGWQVYSVNLDDPASCRQNFQSNIHIGWIIFVGLLIGTYLSV